jgi:hypothetical protein
MKRTIAWYEAALAEQRRETDEQIIAERRRVDLAEDGRARAEKALAAELAISNDLRDMVHSLELQTARLEAVRDARAAEVLDRELVTVPRRQLSPLPHFISGGAHESTLTLDRRRPWWHH